MVKRSRYPGTQVLSKAKNKFSSLLSAIKPSHTLFSLPFAIVSILLVPSSLTITSFFWILVALLSARSSGMLFNRIADEEFDRLNPRTINRDIVTGALSPSFAWSAFTAASILFLFSCTWINRSTLIAAVPTLLAICIYSLTKRFTVFCHFAIGTVLGSVPAAAFVALKDSFNAPPSIILLCLALFFWVSGFDIIYAILDINFDRDAGLFSLPARFGSVHALQIATFLHILALLSLLMTGIAAKLHWIYFSGILFISLLLAFIHHRARDCTKEALNDAFFRMNVWIGILVMLSVATDLLVFKCV